MLALRNPVLLMIVLVSLANPASSTEHNATTRMVYIDGWYSFYMVGDPEEKCFGKNIVNAAGQTEINTSVILGKSMLAAGDLARCGNALPQSLANGWRIKQIFLSQMPGEQTASAGYVVLEK